MTDHQAKAWWTSKADFFVKPIVVGGVAGFGVCSKSTKLMIPFGSYHIAFETCDALISGGMQVDGFTTIPDDGTAG